MSQYWLITHVQKALDLVFRYDIANPAGLVDRQFNEDVIAFPRQKPILFQGFRPGLRDQPVFHGRGQIQRNLLPVMEGVLDNDDRA